VPLQSLPQHLLQGIANELETKLLFLDAFKINDQNGNSRKINESANGNPEIV
jgi:hypothetical protein